MVKLIGTGGNQAPTNNMLGNMAFQNKEGVAIDLLGLAAGTAAAPSLIPTGDPNTGVWFPAADTVSVSTGGTERLRVDSSGNVSIRLSANETRSISFFNTTNSGTYGRIRYTDSSGIFDIGNVAGYPVTLSTNDTERVRVNATGNVGIGTASPTSRVHVYGTTADTQQIAIDGTSNTSSLKLSYNGSQVGFFQNYQNTEINFGTSVSAPIMFYTNNTEKMRLTSAGNFGIGTTSPTVNTGYTSVHVNNNTNGGILEVSNASTVRGWFGVDATGAWLRAVTNHSLYFSTNNTERMRIDSSGRVGVGTTSPNSLLEVRGTSTSFDGYIQVTTAAGGGGARTPAILLKDEYYANQGGLTGNYIASVNAGLNLELASSSTDVYTARAKLLIGSSNTGTIVFSYSANKGVSYTESMRINDNGNLGLGTSTFGTLAAKVMAIGSGTAPTTGPADTIQIYSSDLSAGNTMLSIFTEGTTVNANATAAATHRIAIRVNGTVYYLLANTSA